MGLGRSTRALIVDDHAMVGSALAAALAREPGFDVVGVAASVEQALAIARRRPPDVLVADLQLPEGEVVDHLDRFAPFAPDASVLVMTGLPTERSFLAALRAGVTGFVAKSQPLADLVRAVRRVADGDVVVPPEFVPVLLRHGGVAMGTTKGPGLSARQIEVLQALAHGMSTTAVASELNLAANTVRNHLAGAMAKLGVGSRLAAVSEAIRLGIVSPPPLAAAAR